MNSTLLAALAVAVALVSSGPASADAPPERALRRPAPTVHLNVEPGRAWPAKRSSHRYHRRAFGAYPAAPEYGPHPAFYPGYGGAAPEGPVALSEYREAYIGRGLFYNTPPQPYFPAGPISVRY